MSNVEIIEVRAEDNGETAYIRYKPPGNQIRHYAGKYHKVPTRAEIWLERLVEGQTVQCHVNEIERGGKKVYKEVLTDRVFVPV